jgi:hypothetical protein
VAARQRAEVNIGNPLTFQEKQFILLGMTEAAAVELRYRGREIGQEDILYVRALIDQYPNESRRTLSTKLFEAWQWRQANGATSCVVACS